MLKCSKREWTGKKVSEGCLCVGIANGGNKIFYGCDDSRGLKEGERTKGVSVVQLKLGSARDDRTASVGAFVSEKRLVMAWSRLLIGTEATGDEACERAGETL